MTTVFDNLNEQLFTDITSEQAEMIQGGYNFVGYDGENQNGSILAQANSRIPNLKSEGISSFSIDSGTWKLYDYPDYKGSFIEVGKGTWTLRGNALNNKISSIEKVA